MVPLRFLQCWQGYDRGAEVSFPHPGLAEDLVRQRIAEEIRPRKVKPPAAPSAPAPPTGAVTDAPQGASAAPARVRKK